VFAACLLWLAETDAGLAERLAVVRRWLAPGGAFVFIEVRSDGSGSPVDGPAGRLWPRRDEELAVALRGAGLETVEIRQTRGSFVMGRAVLAE
jgi:hypothetical protein